MKAVKMAGMVAGMAPPALSATIPQANRMPIAAPSRPRAVHSVIVRKVRGSNGLSAIL
ncbi:hypothetical protein [Azospirillum largimobile]